MKFIQSIESAAKSADAYQTMSQLQEQMRDVCHPQQQYDEFYKVTHERGFVGITIPKNKSQAAA
jgi:hypothetical protein